MKNRIAVAYSGVHQAFQLALAVEELGQLERFYCSLYMGKGSWGRVLARLLGSERLFSRHVDGLSAAKIAEYPWPLLVHHCRARFRPKTANDWVQANAWFDKWVASRLRRSGCSVFVGVETCAAESFAAARAEGMTRVLDCPGIDAEFLDELARNAGAQFGLQTLSQADPPAMRERKRRELQLADAIFVCSELQARLLNASAVPPRGVHVLPLWVDTSFWHPANEPVAPRSSHLRVLFAGKINLRKGIPYLIAAAIACDAPVALTLVGSVDHELQPFLKRYEETITIVPPCSKFDLRKHYREHDLLVLPSLGDSFGLVAMEAMACGLAVVVTENCGVPVPHPSWRVPIMDSGAIARRLAFYAGDRSLCREHGSIAAQFARRFTPTGYRENIKPVLQQLLAPAAA
jgi:glycosyltransferase involved in cell wall biosynthesis